MCLFPARKTKQVPFDLFESSAKVLGMRILIASDVGNVRTNNEDLAMAAVPQLESGLQAKGALLLLADGMGGHNSGEVASRMAIKIFSKKYYSTRNRIHALKKAMEAANSEIYKASVQNEEHRGMGTTLSVVAIHNKGIYLAHVGDSRAYLLAKGRLQRLSKDDTMVQLLVDSGKLTTAEAAVHPERNILTNALGTKPWIELLVKRIDGNIRDNVIILLCSDGLYDYITDEEMQKVLSENEDLQIAAAELIHTAKKRGGHDNITVLIAAPDTEIMGRIKDTQENDVMPEQEK